MKKVHADKKDSWKNKLKRGKQEETESGAPIKLGPA